jgi:hypothetical protein
MLRIFSWMKAKCRHFTDEKIIPYTFALSDDPILFRDLLKTNKMYQEGLKLEGKIPGFRLSIGRSYLVFIALWHLILLPASALFHTVLAKIDCHLLILMAILFTGMFFATYAIFKEYLIDTVALRIIKNGWENHFPHFDYDLHAKELGKIYSEALEKEIPHKNLQLYILDRLVETKK